MNYLKLATYKIRNAANKTWSTVKYRRNRLFFFILILLTAWFSSTLAFLQMFSIGQVLGVCFTAAIYGYAVTELRIGDNLLNKTLCLETTTPNLIEGEVKVIEPSKNDTQDETKVEKEFKLPDLENCTPDARPHLERMVENLEKLKVVEDSIDNLNSIIDKKAIMMIVNDSYIKLKEYIMESTRTIATIYVTSQAIKQRELSDNETGKIKRILENCDIAYEEFGQMLSKIPDAIYLKNINIKFDIQASSIAIEKFIQNTPRTDA